MDAPGSSSMPVGGRGDTGWAARLTSLGLVATAVERCPVGGCEVCEGRRAA